jgi:Raf kinase inhibitor-like YbhB/YbcL family protein
MIVECPALTTAGLIPSRYANIGVPGARNISLPVTWKALPEGTGSIAVTIIDIHPVADNWVHWCVVNIPPSAGSIPEGASGRTSALPRGSVECRNTYGTAGYGGPRPPKGSGPHEYVITVYALGVPSLPVSSGSEPGPALRELERAALTRGSVVGIFEQ